MPKAIKYYSDEELEQKLKELENLKAQREKEKKELLDRAKIAYMDKLIADKKNDSQFNQAMNQRIVKMIEGLTSRKDKETKKFGGHHEKEISCNGCRDVCTFRDRLRHSCSGTK